MLQHLHIENYALIRNLDIDFSKGLSVLTGETGAGKSIILGALGLITGERADSRSITEGEKKCVVEAEFVFDEYSANHLQLPAFFRAQDLDYDSQCLIRRELNINGKSRAFINDTPVGLSLLKELSGRLIDIHSQHENLLLKDDAFQLAIVDSVANNEKEYQDYHVAYEEHKEAEQHLKELHERQTKSTADADYIAFQYQQLADARLMDGEEEQLTEELQLLSHTEEIKSALSLTATLLSTDEGGANKSVKDALSSLHHVADYLPQKQSDLAERLDSVLIELRDIASEAERAANNIEYDPELQARTEERLDLLNSLQQKHHCRNSAELIALREQYKSRLTDIEHFDEDILAAEKTSTETMKRLEDAGALLTQTRRAVTTGIGRQLETNLCALGMKNAKMSVELSASTEYTASGKDVVAFLFAANKNQQQRAVTEVASGGEMARIMLCIKSLIAAERGLPTIIFDEIDTGISGEVANTVGEMMRTIAGGRQVIAITHLPQIAACGEAHYKVYKEDSATQTETHIRALSQEERVQEIAGLLAGAKISEAALNAARELITAKHR